MKLLMRERRLEDYELTPWGPWYEIETSAETDAYVDETKRMIAERAAEIRADIERSINPHT